MSRLEINVIVLLILLCWAAKEYNAEEYRGLFDDTYICDTFYDELSYLESELIELGGSMAPYCGSMPIFWSRPFLVTKWCGPGNIASNYEDLGLLRQTDSCCRDHDNCDDKIHKGETKYNLTNPRPLTSMLCSCDAQFHKCLRKVNLPWERLFSWGLGWGYFNAIRQQCFNNSHVAACVEYYETTTRAVPRCKQYAFDETKDKIYQWFDVPKWYE